MQRDLIKYGFLALLLFLTAGCEKVVIPEPPDEDPVFFTDLNVGDLDLNLTAGKSNYELHTRFAKDSEDVMTFVGLFRPSDCTAAACPKSLRIVIRDFQKFNESNFNIEKSLSTKDYQYSWNRHSDSVEILFKVEYDTPNNVNSLRPQFKLDGAKIIASGSIGEVRAIFDRNIPYQIVLETMNGREKHRQIQTIDLAKGQNCRTQLVVRSNRLLARVTKGAKPYRFAWEGMDHTTEWIELDRTSDRKSYSVTVTDADDCQCQATIENLQLVANDRASASADFVPMQIGHVASKDSLKFGNVRIDYFDADRKILSTRRFSQPARSKFRILSISDFMDNEAGYRTKKMEIELACMLYGVDVTDALPLKGKVTMAVAYPN